MKRAILLFYVFVTLVLPAAGVFITRSVPTLKRHNPEFCTMHCHDRTCNHKPLIADARITSDTGLFGQAIAKLSAAGKKIAKSLGVSSFEGYGIANLLIFCVGVPVLHVFLMILNFSLASRVYND